jgi:phosphoglycerate dehydrogenase-like enzyme
VKILVVSKIDPDALTLLQAHHDVVVAINPDEEALISAIADRQVLVFRSGVEITRRALEAAPHLALLLRAGSGLDNIDLAYIEQRGIELRRVPGPGAQSVAELTFGLMLAMARNVVAADASMRAGRWLKSDLMGHLLAGKTLGVIGLGSIGTLVARMGIAWGMTAIGCVERPSSVRAAGFAEERIRLADCDEVIAAADFLSIHVPLKPGNVGLIGVAALQRMKRGAFLVNIARGGIVDEDALLHALQGGEIAGAALDVHAVERDGHRSALADLPNVVLTPHLGASTFDSQREIGREVVSIVATLGGLPGTDATASARAPSSFLEV